jgi:hypothetical protein
MATVKRLRDLYRFPGFVPRLGVHGVFGDPHAVVIALVRRRKKRSAAPADKRAQRATTSAPVRPATSPAATSASIWPTLCAVSLVRGVAA